MIIAEKVHAYNIRFCCKIACATGFKGLWDRTWKVVYSSDAHESLDPSGWFYNNMLETLLLHSSIRACKSLKC